MRVIPVIDLKAGLVVRGVAGRRDEYRPIVSHLVSEPTPRAVADAFVKQFGFGEVYVADLDSIEGRAANVSAYDAIQTAGLNLWIDAGIATAEAAYSLSAGSTVIMGLESLQSPEELGKAVKQCGVERLIFSLDLKAGRPNTTIAAWREYSSLEIAQAAVALDIRRIIILDLADVGVGRGTGTLDLVQLLRAAHPQLELTAGGGVRGVADLRAMADAGCDAALVASALHDGRLTSGDVQSLRRSTSATLL
jgi:phosphoribosylformimino-5-aminoimidazole carboxamide ribotide isomerase